MEIDIDGVMEYVKQQAMQIAIQSGQIAQLQKLSKEQQAKIAALEKPAKE